MALYLIYFDLNATVYYLYAISNLLYLLEPQMLVFKTEDILRSVKSQSLGNVF